MISPEMLRFYPFFGTLDAEQRKEIAMISEEVSAPQAQEIYRKGEMGKALYIVLEGQVDLNDVLTTELDPTFSREYLVGEMQTGSIIGIGALVDPFKMNTTARCASPCRLIRIDAGELLSLAEKDARLGYLLMEQVAKMLMEQLNVLRGVVAAS